MMGHLLNDIYLKMYAKQGKFRKIMLRHVEYFSSQNARIAKRKSVKMEVMSHLAFNEGPSRGIFISSKHSHDWFI